LGGWGSGNSTRVSRSNVKGKKQFVFPLSKTALQSPVSLDRPEIAQMFKQAVCNLFDELQSSQSILLLRDCAFIAIDGELDKNPPAITKPSTSRITERIRNMIS